MQASEMLCACVCMCVYVCVLAQEAREGEVCLVTPLPHHKASTPQGTGCRMW